MAMDFATTASFLLMPAIILLISAGSALVTKIPDTVTAALQHFAAGVVLSAVAIELVPIMLETAAPIWAISVGFLLGVIMFLCIRKTMGHGHGGEDDEHGGGHDHGHGGHGGGQEEHGGHGAGHCAHDHGDDYTKMEEGGSIPWAGILPVLIDFSCDGLLMGLSFSAGESAGLILVLSIALEMSSVGAAIFQGSLRGKGVSVGKSFGVMVFLGVSLFGVGLISYMISEQLAGSSLFYGLISFGIVACLWLSAEDLLKESCEGEEEMAWVTAMFFLGFLLPVILEKLADGKK